MKSSAVETLQAATVISKTTQTLIGHVIDCHGYERLTLFYTYTKGDETGITLIPWFLTSPTGAAHQFGEWSTAAGAKTWTEGSFTHTATKSGYIDLDVEWVDYVKFTQGGTANDGTPTGTLAAQFVLKG